jgi:hypothetical protein
MKSQTIFNSSRKCIKNLTIIEGFKITSQKYSTLIFRKRSLSFVLRLPLRTAKGVNWAKEKYSPKSYSKLT